MAAEIFGTLYEDLNQNGQKDPSEDGMPDWQIYLDMNQDGVLGEGEPVRVTNVDGDYSFAGIAAGSYRVAEVLKPGWTPTSPLSKDVIVEDERKVRADFFNFAGGDLRGSVWNDLDGDGARGVDPETGEYSEPGLAGWKVFLDLNTNGLQEESEPIDQTDGSGQFAFLNLPSGDYDVFEILPENWEPTRRHDSSKTVAVVVLQTSNVEFGNVSLSNGGIRGVVFNDVNANGDRDVDSTSGEFVEPGLVGWVVFVDENLDGVLDEGELTSVTDGDGEYVFPSLPAGSHRVIEQMPEGWSPSPGTSSEQTVFVVAGDVTTAQAFANFTVLDGSIRGLVWNDLNRNGVRDFNALTGVYTDPPIGNWRILLDRNRNGLQDEGEPIAVTSADGIYRFSGLQIGEYKIQQILPAGWEVAPTFNDSQTIVVFSGAESLAGDFANYDANAASPGSITGVVFHDADSNGLHSSTEPTLEGWTVFLDQNNNAVQDPSEPSAVTLADGLYRFAGIPAGTIGVGILPKTGWRATSPVSNRWQVTLRSGQELTGFDFGQHELTESSISGRIFADKNRNGIFDSTEKGLAGLTVYLDLNNNQSLDLGEPSHSSSSDLFYTPSIDEAGVYQFTHLAAGTYVVRTIIPDVLSATPEVERHDTVILGVGESRSDLTTAAVYRLTEIHGKRFEDLNGNAIRDPDEPPMVGRTVFVDLNRNSQMDSDEPQTTTTADGSYAFVGLAPDNYVIREIVDDGYTQTSPGTRGGILWPSGTSNPAVGIVSPTEVTTVLQEDQSFSQTVSITLPGNGALTNLVDVFLLFDDTGSFVNNSPIVRAAFPDIIARLQTQLPGIDLGFGVGRMEEYANFAAEFATGRPFTLNQPIVAASTAGYLASIQAALNRTAPGYGGDQPETDIEALFQVVTGRGFDGNNNGSLLDSGPAGLASTQINPGNSGDVPPFSSFVSDPANLVMASAGNIGGAGFRSGSLPIILLATDTGFAYQPKGETNILGAGGLSLPVSMLTQTSRPTTPFNSGAGIQETITGLNALGGLVIGLGTNAGSNVDPRQQLESISKLTGAINRSTSSIANGTLDDIAPGDPLYFQIASGFSGSVANGVINAIQNAVTHIAVDIDVRASDPRIRLVNHSGIRTGIGAGMTASFDVEFIGDGAPHRFDLQFVRAGTSVVLGSIPIVIGTNIHGDGYHWEDVEDGDVVFGYDFSDRSSSSLPANSPPSFIKGSDQQVDEEAGPMTVLNWASSILPGPSWEAHQQVDFLVTSSQVELFAAPPAVSPEGTLTFTPALNAFGTAVVEIRLHDNGGTDNGGVDTSEPQYFTISILPVNDPPTIQIAGTTDGFQGVTGQVRSVALSADDSADSFTGPFIYEVIWGDGSPSESLSGSGTMSLSHTFLSAGVHSTQFRVSDPLGGSSEWKTLDLSIQSAEHQGDVWALGGTSNDDLMSISPAAIAGQLTLVLNGEWIATIDGTGSDIRFFGGPGRDTVQVDGSTSSDQILIDASRMTIGGGFVPGRILGIEMTDGEYFRIQAGAGDDQIRLLRGAAEIHGGEGIDQLYGPALDTVWQITGSGTGSLHGNSFDGIESLVGNAANDAFLLETTGTLAGGVIGGSGQDSLLYSGWTQPVSVSLIHNLATGIQSLEGIEIYAGGASKKDSFEGRSSPNSFQVGVDGMVRLNKANKVVGFEQLAGGPSDDEFRIEAGLKTPYSVQGAGGNDALSYAGWSTPVFIDQSRSYSTALSSFASVEKFIGGEQFDSLIGSSQANRWLITGPGSGRLNESQFEAFENLTGGESDDHFVIQPSGGIRGTLNAGAGVNTLDYSSWTRNVTIRSDLGIATSIGYLQSSFQILMGGSGNDTIHASAWSSILVGNAGNDLLVGSNTRRDLLIGGRDSDTLRGGGGDDILLGSYSSFDRDPDDLKWLLSEWNSGRTYLQRVNNLRGTPAGGPRFNGNRFLGNSPVDTVFDDLASDRLFGEAGRDWFFKSPNDDLVDLAFSEWVDDPGR